MSSLAVKSFIGLILIFIAFYSLVWNHPYLLLAELIGIGGRGIYELARLNSRNPKRAFMLMSLTSSSLITFLYKNSILISFEKLLEWNLIFLILGVIGIFMLLQGKKSGLWLAHFWISIPLFSVWLGYQHWVQCFSNEFVLNPLCLFIGSISGGDSLAMFAGKLSKNKIFIYPNISPNKTLQGTIGYLVGAHIIALSWCSWLNWSLYLGSGIAFVSFIFGLGGDLLESALKRKCATKDTGKLIPGHGGVLDRFDSIFLAVLPCMLYYIFINR